MHWAHAIPVLYLPSLLTPGTVTWQEMQHRSKIIQPFKAYPVSCFTIPLNLYNPFYSVTSTIGVQNKPSQPLLKIKDIYRGMYFAFLLLAHIGLMDGLVC